MKNAENYVGNPLQVRGAEEYTLNGGRGDGMHFLYVRNGLGLSAWISISRAADLSRLEFLGVNMGYFSPCGYVAPQYYDPNGDGFLKSFTAGFFTTCGLTAVGMPCTDEGEILPLHGTISNTPAKLLSREETAEGLRIKLQVEECCIFGRKLCLFREYFFSYRENSIQLKDAVTNCGDGKSPYMILYHCNMGYPLLSEQAVLKIPNLSVTARDDYAARFADTALHLEKPTPNDRERCYYYDVAEKVGLCHAGIYNDELRRGVILEYRKAQLPRFTQWKMMGQRDYVLGLEPGNCTPDGRDVLRKNGTLQFLEPGETQETQLTFIFTENRNQFEGVF